MSNGYTFLECIIIANRQRALWAVVLSGIIYLYLYLYKCIVKNLSLGFCEGMSVYFTLHMGIIYY